VKTDCPLYERAHHAAGRLWGIVALLAVVLTVATFALRPELLENYRSQPARLLVPLAAALCLGVMRRAHRDRRHGLAFLGSSGVIAALLAATAIGAYPYLLRSQPFPERSLTVANTAAASSGLVTATLWLLPGVVLILVYQIVLYRVFAGKVRIDAGAHY